MVPEASPTVRKKISNLLLELHSLLRAFPQESNFRTPVEQLQTLALSLYDLQFPASSQDSSLDQFGKFGHMCSHEQLRQDFFFGAATTVGGWYFPSQAGRNDALERTAACCRMQLPQSTTPLNGSDGVSEQ